MTDRERIESTKSALLDMIAGHERSAEFWKNRDSRQHEFHKGRIFELQKVLKMLEANE